MKKKNNCLYKLLLTGILAALFCLNIGYAQQSSPKSNNSQPSANQAESSTTQSNANTATKQINGAELPKITEPSAVNNSESSLSSESSTATDVTTTEKIENQDAKKVVADIMTEDLTAWYMFLSAGLIVKIVMGILVLLSVLTWSIAIAKFWQVGVARKKIARELAIVSKQDSFIKVQENSETLSFASKLISKAAKEIKLSAPNSDSNNVKDRIGSIFNDIVSVNVRNIRYGVGPLATVGAVSPFIGLFGTVWGIMNSFIGIAQTKTTNLSVVAPGIAEALLATALGLVAAIPAVILFNYFAKSVASYRSSLTDLASAVMLLTSRMLDNNAANKHK